MTKKKPLILSKKKVISTDEKASAKTKVTKTAKETKETKQAQETSASGNSENNVLTVDNGNSITKQSIPDASCDNSIGGNDDDEDVLDEQQQSQEELARLEREERKAAERVKNLNKVISKVISLLQPPEDLTVSEWAEKHRRLSSEASAEPGRWRNDRTPYLIEPMNSFNDPKIRNIVMVAASQVGKSEFINNCIGYVIDQDPGSILFIQPTTLDAKEYSKLRIAPMIRDCPTLKSKVSDAKSRDSGNTILQKSYPGGILTLCGSTEAHALASKPIRYVFGDEKDRWKSSAGDEGDPWTLAKARQTTFYNAKSIEVSTPTIKGSSAIAASYAKGTQEHWKSCCPHCGEYNEIAWESIRYEYTEHGEGSEKTFEITDVYYICPSCGGISSEYAMKKAPAHWTPDNPAALENGCRSFWLNAFVSVWSSWESIILEFLEARGDPEKLKPVYNTKFGKLWESRGDTQSEDDLLIRREDYTAELPDGVLVLTMGVDTQDNRLEYEVVGYGHFGESWGIKRGVIMGRPSDGEVWQAFDDIRDTVFRFSDGVGMKISRVFIDEGGHYTMEVRRECKAREGKNVFCIKGQGGESVPFVTTPKLQKITIDNRYVGNCYQFPLGVDAGKAEIMHNLSVTTIGSRYCHFPKNDDYGITYFNGLLSEHIVYDREKRKMSWHKIPGHERNEPLDCRVYSLAAFKSLAVSLDATEKRLIELRQRKAQGSEIDTVNAIRKAQKKPHKAKRSNKKMGFDSW